MRFSVGQLHVLLLLDVLALDVVLGVRVQRSMVGGGGRMDGTGERGALALLIRLRQHVLCHQHAP